MDFIGRVKSFICNKVNILTFIILVLCLIVGIQFYCLQQMQAEQESNQISFDEQYQPSKVYSKIPQEISLGILMTPL